MRLWNRLFTGMIALGLGPLARAESKVDFVRDVQPIFKEHCYKCHGAEKRKGELRLDLKAYAVKGGENGPILVPGNSEKSLLVQRLVTTKEEDRMPQKAAPFSAQQIALIRKWIDQGAEWPEAANPVEKKHWAYQPLAQPAVPKVRGKSHNPIDAFILTKLEQKGLKPSPPADPGTLLRRVTLDLTGLPPTPEEIKAFLADPSPAAYERVVDRLLASPRHGERWARHWLDIVHYADTHGHDQDRPRPNAWPYRDYLIHSFNADKPYARFVQEQLAGDALFPDDPDGIVALGFIAAGPWDESSQMHIMADTLDKKIAQNYDRDDMLTATLQTFLSTTINCARCHDHKFDPIAQTEYYALQSCFAGVDRVDRPYDADPRVHRLRLGLLQQKAALEVWARDRDPTKLPPLTPVEASGYTAWEKSLGERIAAWTVLDPAEFRSANGATLVKQPDGSLLSGGNKPETDTYTIVAHTTLLSITAVRLEVMTDDSLAHKGPGRQDNGNLHLTEFQVQADGHKVTLQNPTADFNQQDWGIEKAIDGNKKTAWGIYPEVGKPHYAIFEFKEDVGTNAESTLTFTLEQQHGGGHLIGRPRLSLTNSPRPVRANPLPANIATIVAVAPDQRTELQRADLLAFHRLEQIGRDLAAFPPPQKVYAVASDFPQVGNFSPAKTPRPIFLLRRGEITQPLAPAAPGGLAFLEGLSARFDLPDPTNEAARRAALARWLTDPHNSLAWRSIVNRVWHYHFGRGIVSSPNDFGRMSPAPTHPELLDWLAVWFRDQGGSFKKLHKLIVMSATYQQSSAHNEKYAKMDGDNLYLWRMNRARLDAEEIRDAVLAVSGKLDLTMGGPAVMQFHFEDPLPDLTPKVDYMRFDVDSPASYRRSIYRYLFRTVPDPFMDTLDCPDASQLTPARTTSFSALQALTMFHNRFVLRQSEHLAERVTGNSVTAQIFEQTAPGSKSVPANPQSPISNPPSPISTLYRLVLGRAPTPTELNDMTAYAAKHGLANACRLLLNSNEFMFVN